MPKPKPAYVPDPDRLWKEQIDHWQAKHPSDAARVNLVFRPMMFWRRHGRRTTCALILGPPHAPIAAIGTACRNIHSVPPNVQPDRPNPRVAHELSLYRAICDLASQLKADRKWSSPSVSA